MDFKKKLKIRLRRSIAYIIAGVLLIAVGFIGKLDNYFFSSFGFALLVIGILQTVKNASIMKNEDNLKEQEIIETDERNIMLAHRARSLTFSISVFAMGVAAIVLSVIGMGEIAKYIGFVICIELLINFVCYAIMQKKY